VRTLLPPRPAEHSGCLCGQTPRLLWWLLWRPARWLKQTNDTWWCTTRPVFIKQRKSNVYIYTYISIASISFTRQMKFIPRWTPLALSPRKGTENTNDVRNSPLFLECCYFKIASTRCKAILIASPNKYRISQYRLRLLLFTSFYSVYVQFNPKTFT